MATAEELLAQATGDSAENNILVIDRDLRTIQIPSGVKNLGVESDDEVLTVQFKMPSTYCGIDLSTFKIRINYLNAKAEGDVYEVADLQKVDDYMTFSWTVGRHAALYKGTVKFNVCLKEIDSDNNVTREFNTTIATLPILEGLETGEQVIAEYGDILEQWRAQLFGTGDTIEAGLIAIAENAKQEINTLVEDTRQEIDHIVDDKAQEINIQVTAAIKSINDHGEKYVESIDDAIQSIEDKGNEVLATIPNDYTKLSNISDKILRTKANAITNTEEGYVIRADAASNDPIRGLKLYGRSEQVVTTGKQLLNLSDIEIDSGGTTVVTIRYGGREIHVTGTKSYAMAIARINVSSMVGTTLYLNGSITGGNRPSFTIRKIAADGTRTYIKSDELINNGYLVEDGIETLELQFICNNTDTTLETATTAIFTDTIISTTKGDVWEPYTGGQPSPRPDHHQDILGLTDFETVMYGKNLLEPKDDSNGGYTATVNPDGSVTVTGSATTDKSICLTIGTPRADRSLCLDRNTTYHMWGESSNGQYIGIKTNNIYRNATYSTATNWNRNNGTDYMDIVQIYLESNGHEIGDTKLCGTYRFQLEVGDKFTGFEPYKTPKTIFTGGFDCFGIPVETGGNYTDSNGQQWLCDEYDFERGVFIQRIGHKTFTGSGDEQSLWTRYSRMSVGEDATFAVQISDRAYDSPVLCNRYVYDNTTNMVCERRGTFGITSGTDQKIVFNGGATAYDLSGWFETLASFSPALTIIYALATPIELSLPDDFMSAFKETYTNYPTTTVACECMIDGAARAYATGSLFYNHDTQTYLDSIVKDYLDENMQDTSDERVNNLIDTALEEQAKSIPSDDHIREVADSANLQSQIDTLSNEKVNETRVNELITNALAAITNGETVTF